MRNDGSQGGSPAILSDTFSLRSLSEESHPGGNADQDLERERETGKLYNAGPGDLIFAQQARMESRPTATGAGPIAVVNTGTPSVKFIP